MKIVVDDKGNYVTTPVYVGTAAEIETAQRCDHKWIDVPGAKAAYVRPDVTMMLQKCSECVARRCKLEGDEAIILKLLIV